MPWVVLQHGLLTAWCGRDGGWYHTHREEYKGLNAKASFDAFPVDDEVLQVRQRSTNAGNIFDVLQMLPLTGDQIHIRQVPRYICFASASCAGLGKFEGPEAVPLCRDRSDALTALGKIKERDFFKTLIRCKKFMEFLSASISSVARPCFCLV